MRWISVVAAAALVSISACNRTPEECLVANRCHRGSCTGPIVRTGCGACQAGEINENDCPHDGGAQTGDH